MQYKYTVRRTYQHGEGVSFITFASSDPHFPLLVHSWNTDAWHYDIVSMTPDHTNYSHDMQPRYCELNGQYVMAANLSD